jgi:hypothetical protein
MRLGFDWNSHEMSVMFLAKLAKPLIGTCRIVINSLHIKGDVCPFLSLLPPLFVSFLLLMFCFCNFAKYCFLFLFDRTKYCFLDPES